MGCHVQKPIVPMLASNVPAKIPDCTKAMIGTLLACNPFPLELTTRGVTAK